MAERVAETKALLPSDTFSTDYANMLKTFGPDLKTQQDQALGLRLLQGGVGLMGNQSPFFDPSKAMPAIEGYGQDIKNIQAQKMDLAKQQFELGKFGYNTAADIVKSAQADEKATIANLTKIYGDETTAKRMLESARISAGATITAAGISAEKAGAKERQGIKTEFDALVAQGYDPNSPITKQVAQQNYFAATRPYGASSMVSAIGQRIAQDGQLKSLNTQLQIAQMGNDTNKVKEIEAQITARTQAIQQEVQQNAKAVTPGAGSPVVTPTPIPPPNPAKPVIPPGNLKRNPDGSFNYELTPQTP